MVWAYRSDLTGYFPPGKTLSRICCCYCYIRADLPFQRPYCYNCFVPADGSYVHFYWSSTQLPRCILNAKSNPWEWLSFVESKELVQVTSLNIALIDNLARIFFGCRQSEHKHAYFTKFIFLGQSIIMTFFQPIEIYLSHVDQVWRVRYV